MNSIIQDIFQLLTSSSGSMAFHLLITFVVISAMYPTLSLHLNQKTEQTKRLLIGLSGLLLVRFGLFVFAGLATQNIGGLNSILPVVDRVADVLSLVIITWLWAYPESSRLGDSLMGLVSLIIIIVGVFSATSWVNQAAPNTFNGTTLGFMWVLIIVGVSFGGQIILIQRQPYSWTSGLTMLLIIFLGSLPQLIFPNPNSDYPEYIRLAYIAAFPLLFGLTNRIYIKLRPAAAPVIEESLSDTAPSKTKELQEDLSELETSPSKSIQEEEAVPEPTAEKGLDLKLFQSALAFANEENPQEICKLVTYYVSKALVADISLLLSPPDPSGKVTLNCGYDLIIEQGMGNVTLNLEAIPEHAKLIQDRLPVRVGADKSHLLKKLAKGLKLKKIGDFMAVPLIDENSELLGFMAVISPYSNYKWTEEDEEYLNASSASLAAVIKKAQGTSQNKFMMEDLNSQLESKLGENKTLVEKNDQLAQELAGLEDQINNMASINTEKNILIEEKINLENEISILEEKVIQNEKQREQHNISEETVVSVSVMASETIAELETENKKLKLSLDKSIEAQSNSDNSITELTENHKTELHEAIERIEDLQNKLKSNKDLLEINLTKIEDGVGISPEQADVIASIAQELRQPMSSISGYTDLLLGESVGILGALQRKFLDRVKNSTDRMNNLINDLLQITALESGNIALSQNAIELTEVVDEIISMTSGQLREKNIALRVNLPSKLPQINSDKDAVQQILIHLLQNAGDASPEEGEIFLKAKTHEEDNDNEYIQIEITDTGEGIPQEDIPRVFSRLYRADNPLIQGVGDTGVGLSIAKTLTEALGGRIWVESEIQKGSTFSVILPLSPPSQNGDS